MWERASRATSVVCNSCVYCCRGECRWHLLLLDNSLEATLYTTIDSKYADAAINTILLLNLCLWSFLWHFYTEKKFHGSLDPVNDILSNYEFPHHFPMSFISFRKNSDDNVHHLTIKRVRARGANIDGVLSVNQILLKGLM